MHAPPAVHKDLLIQLASASIDGSLTQEGFTWTFLAMSLLLLLLLLWLRSFLVSSYDTHASLGIDLPATTSVGLLAK